MGQKLGQHFLINEKVLQKIASALELEKNDVVIEIGPGHGELTDALLQIANNEAQIIAIEKDPVLAQALTEKYRNQKNIQIIEGDAREKLEAISSKLKAPYKLAGNIPYYLTGFLFRIVGELPQKPSNIVFTIQKEVAERIATAPPKMSLIAASIQIWAEPKIISIIPKRDFLPTPKVDSAILQLIPHKNMPPKEKMEKYYRLIKIIFKQPRKTILNNLSFGLGRPKSELEEELAKIGIPPEERPSFLSANQLLELINFLPDKNGE